MSTAPSASDLSTRQQQLQQQLQQSATQVNGLANDLENARANHNKLIGALIIINELIAGSEPVADAAPVPVASRKR